MTFTYSAPSGSAVLTMYYKQYTVAINFGAKTNGGSAIGEYPGTLISLVDFNATAWRNLQRCSRMLKRGLRQDGSGTYRTLRR